MTVTYIYTAMTYIYTAVTHIDMALFCCLQIRDLSIAYILVAVTYIYMGVMFYSSFPLNKDCIEDVRENPISSSEVLAFTDSNHRCCFY
jgi:hypothetical protein